MSGAPRVEVLAGPDDVARRAQELVYDALVHARREERRPVLCLATGRSMELLYARLAADARAEALRVDDIDLVALDEYLGLPADDEHSFRAELTRRVLTPWGRRSDSLLMPPAGAGGHSARPEQADLDAFETALAGLGGVDLQLLGIGRNGHIGFNEPGTDWQRGTHIVALDRTTRAANAEQFPGGVVPVEAVTQGVSTIMRARRILLLATGSAKAEAVAAALAGPSLDCPASALQVHPAAVMVIDREAAGLLVEQS